MRDTCVLPMSAILTACMLWPQAVVQAQKSAVVVGDPAERLVQHA